MTPVRITLSRTKGYRRPDGTIQVDRATIFGNPWQVGNPGIWWMPNEGGARWWGEYRVGFHVYRSTAVAAFDAWIKRGHLPEMPPMLSKLGRIHMTQVMAIRRDLILARLPDLRGHDLGCRCAQGTPCHADVLLELANK